MIKHAPEWVQTVCLVKNALHKNVLLLAIKVEYASNETRSVKVMFPWCIMD